MSNTTYSPYQATKVVNGWIADLGVEKELPPQMLYTYVGKGYIKSFVGEDGKKKVTNEDLKNWFDNKYAPKNLFKKDETVTETVVDENQMTIDEIDTVEA